MGIDRFSGVTGRGKYVKSPKSKIESLTVRLGLKTTQRRGGRGSVSWPRTERDSEHHGEDEATLGDVHTKSSPLNVESPTVRLGILLTRGFGVQCTVLWPQPKGRGHLTAFELEVNCVSERRARGLDPHTLVSAA
jgi:hypothetical protein